MFPSPSDIPFLLNLLQFFDASSVTSYASFTTLLDNSQVQASCDVYCALYDACATSLSSPQSTANVSVAQQCAFLLRSVSDEMDRNPTLVHARLAVLSSLCEAHKVAFQKHWMELPRQQQCSLLCMAVGSGREEEMTALEKVLGAVEECLLVDEHRDAFWTLFCPVFFTHLFSFFRAAPNSLLNKQTVGSPLCLRQPICLLLHLLCFLQDIDFSITWNEWEICTIAYKPKEEHTSHAIMCSAFATAFKTTMMSITDEVCSGDPPDEMLLQFCMLLSVWSVLIAMRKGAEKEECNHIQRALKRIHFHSELGARAWCMLFSLCDIHRDYLQSFTELLNCFYPFFEKCFDSNLLLGFDTPKSNEVFRYDLFLSTQHSDTLLLILLSSSPSFQSLFLSTSAQTFLVDSLPSLLSRMPYRSSLHLCAGRLLLDPSLSSDKAASLFQVLLAMPDRAGKALKALFDQSTALRPLIKANIDAVWNSSLLQSNRPNLQRATLVFVEQFYQTVPRKKQMLLLLFLERDLIYESCHTIRAAAQDVLTKILQNSDNLDLVHSFTRSFIKKEWAKTKTHSLALFALVEGLAPALPQLIPFLLAFALSGAKKTIPSQWLTNSLLSIASVCLYDMDCTHFTQSLKAVCPDSSARKLLRASFVMQVLHQVSVGEPHNA